MDEIDAAEGWFRKKEKSARKKRLICSFRTN